MTISKLSDAELSRWVAEKIDPDKVLGNGIWFQAMYNQVKHHDMVNDPAMTVMLLGKLAESPFYIKLLISDGLFTLEDGPRHWTAEPFSNFQRVVAEAFALANGWKANVP